MVPLAPFKVAILNLKQGGAETDAACEELYRVLASRGVDALYQEFEKLGGGLSGDTVKALAEADDSLDRLHFSTNTLKGTLVGGLAPSGGAIAVATQFGQSGPSVGRHPAQNL